MNQFAIASLPRTLALTSTAIAPKAAASPKLGFWRALLAALASVAV